MIVAQHSVSIALQIRPDTVGRGGPGERGRRGAFRCHGVFRSACRPVAASKQHRREKKQERPAVAGEFKTEEGLHFAKISIPQAGTVQNLGEMPGVTEVTGTKSAVVTRTPGICVNPIYEYYITKL